MQVHFLETGQSPKITLTINGSLTVKGWDQPRVQINTASKENMGLDQQDDAFSISCNDNCALNVPHKATLLLQTVNGHTTIKAVEGELTSEVINGNIDLRSVGPVILRKVEGNISAKDVDGDMKVDRVNGNLTVRDIQGNLSVQDRISGNLNFYDADGDAVASADGNINLRLDPSPGNNFDFTAKGNIVCRLPEDVSAEIVIESASKIIVNLPLDLEALEEDQVNKHPVAPYSLVLGEGDSKIRLSSSGGVILGSEAPEWDFAEDIDFDIDDEISAMSESITEQVEQQLESQMEMLEQQLEIQMEMLSARLGMAGIAGEEARRIEERSRQAAERATQRAQEKIRRAQERLEQKLAAAQRKAEQKARIAARKSRAHHRHPFSVNIATHPRMPAEEPVSDEERLVILRMLEQKKITPEEAEQLLAALEGIEA
jgi:DUF4097 and DUF4098 domain-containing protein YvlB